MTKSLHMVACFRCGLLVGWADAPPPRVVCIPCFDHVHAEFAQDEENKP